MVVLFLILPLITPTGNGAAFQWKLFDWYENSRDEATARPLNHPLGPSVYRTVDLFTK